ncbi:hypothetical protein EVAR_53559_1 [Eumeta japonica]|uniref:Uncharacterized protein n=1 Tax=Eumeta variegata TaxID=151549 RepID=A0A4C1YT03_EUMVA|nr:hypothetical protein EVAR_53559_1 [Eumeta japonica]
MLQYNARNFTVVRIVTRVSQWRKVGARQRRRKGRGLDRSQAIQRGKVSQVGIFTQSGITNRGFLLTPDTPITPSKLEPSVIFQFCLRFPQAGAAAAACVWRAVDAALIRLTAKGHDSSTPLPRCDVICHASLSRRRRIDLTSLMRFWSCCCVIDSEDNSQLLYDQVASEPGDPTGSKRRRTFRRAAGGDVKSSSDKS